MVSEAQPEHLMWFLRDTKDPALTAMQRRKMAPYINYTCTKLERWCGWYRRKAHRIREICSLKSVSSLVVSFSSESFLILCKVPRGGIREGLWGFCREVLCRANIPGTEGSRGVQGTGAQPLQVGDHPFHGRCKNSVKMGTVQKILAQHSPV